MTLGGQVASDSDKQQADSIARSVTGNLVVADQIAVVQQGTGSMLSALVLDRNMYGRGDGLPFLP